MRVDVAFDLEGDPEKLEISRENSGPQTGTLDLRANPALLEQIESARHQPALRNFLATVNSADSFLATVRSKTWTHEEERLSSGTAGTDRYEFASQVDLIFAFEPYNFDCNRYKALTQRLEELLTRETGHETLRVELRVHPCRFPQGDWGFSLAIVLRARATALEHAQLRWGLGLARVQQALLFTSRMLRQQIERSG